MAKDVAVDATGRSRTVTGCVTAELADQLGATLRAGHVPGTPREGDPLPPLWHWTAFPPTVPMEELGTDGHPQLGTFLPDLGLARRMWASGSLKFHAPLHVGEALTQRSRITGVAHKTSAAGPMAFVTVAHEILAGSVVAIEEEQTIVYLRIPDSFVPPRKVPAPENPAFDIPVKVTTPLLFRYSSVTFNAHRIHYDRPYAMEVEHYPGLVVHGPLQATLLMEAAVRHRGRAPAAFSFRGIHPMFDTHDLRLIGVTDPDDAMALCTAAPDGHQGVQARAEWS